MPVSKLFVTKLIDHYKHHYLNNCLFSATKPKVSLAQLVYNPYRSTTVPTRWDLSQSQPD